MFGGVGSPIFNKYYRIKFSFSIFKKQNNNLVYKNKNLILNFMETYLFNKNDWINYFIDYQINFNLSKNNKFNYFREILEDDLTQENKQDYILDNLENIKENLSNYLTNLYSNNMLNNKKYWLYNDYKIKVRVEYYKYLGVETCKKNLINFFKEFLSLTFSFTDNLNINVKIDLIFLIKLI